MAFQGPEVLLGAVLLALPVLIGGLAIVLIGRMRRSGGIEKALVNMVLHSGRRRRFLIEISTMSAVVIAGLVAGSASLIIPGSADIEELGLVVIFLAGSAMVLVLTMEGLRNTELTLGDGLRLRDNFPQLSARIQEDSNYSLPGGMVMYFPNSTEPESSSMIVDTFASGRRPRP